ncbi:MAG: aspartyl/glutamyl-tRNA(Asn/Gln) amidotransferase subunit [Actinomycetia bacterium]|nr:aspartyl/glutamyl-tRNA(Asn/Gln) amidotransferase subunit [Actinomycetes bacterium]
MTDTTDTADASRTDQWETVVGLEVHVELATVTKLFCACPNLFGAEPNTNICPVCLGLPGSLPVLNERVVEFALRVGEAFHFDVPERSIFHRKNYFYPDMPKDFQTTQYDEPICLAGWLDVDGVRVGITRAHLEEDTGKSVHLGGGGRIHDASHSLVDYNRAGVPLMEIVSEPDMRSSEQARRYVEELRATLLAIGVSDVKMEEGSLRVDANISVRHYGDEFGTRAEIKNVNSLRSLARAIDYEHDRQIEMLERGERVKQETRHWDEEAGCTRPGRSKEEPDDYRYFPEPDLVPIAPSAELRAHVRASMPELPAAQRTRLIDEWGINDHEAGVLLSTPGLAEYAETAVVALDGGGTPKDVVNWATNDVLSYVNETGLSPALLAPEMLAELVRLVGDGTISRNQARDVLAESLREEKWPKAIVSERGLAQVSDEGALGAAVDDVLAQNADAVEEWRSGDDKVKKKKRGFLMGECMKALKGQGNPQLLNRLLDERLARG